MTLQGLQLFIVPDILRDVQNVIIFIVYFTYTGTVCILMNNINFSGLRLNLPLDVKLLDLQLEGKVTGKCVLVIKIFSVLIINNNLTKQVTTSLDSNYCWKYQQKPSGWKITYLGEGHITHTQGKLTDPTL